VRHLRVPHRVGPLGGGGTFNLQNDGIGSEVVIETGASLALLGAGGRTIQGVGGGNRFINRGELRVALDGAGDAFEVAGSTFQNAAGGSVRVEAGTLRSDLNGTLSGTSLRGGDWFVGDGGAVDAVGRTITAINAAVELSGAGSSFAAIDSLSRVADRGTFRVTGGRDFQTDAGVAAFTVDGALEVGAGSSFGVTNALANLSAGTLSGGSFVVGGSLELAQGGSIAALEAALTLAGTGAVRDGSGGDLLASLAEIRDAGAFALRDGAVFTTAGDLALDGTLDIGRGSAADVRGDLSAFQGGVFGAADLRVRGDVIADNARVQAVEGRLVVGLGGRILARDGGGTVDGLSFLAEVRGGGSVELAEGRDLDLRATTNTVAVEGSLILGATGAGGPDALLGSVLHRWLGLVRGDRGADQRDRGPGQLRAHRGGRRDARARGRERGRGGVGARRGRGLRGVVRRPVPADRRGQHHRDGLRVPDGRGRPGRGPVLRAVRGRDGGGRGGRPGPGRGGRAAAGPVGGGEPGSEPDAKRTGSGGDACGGGRPALGSPRWRPD
jgi:hypothetical protein